MRRSYPLERVSPFTNAGFARMLERAGTVLKLSFNPHPHMVRHACGFALANRGHDTRALQAYLGHRMLAYGRYTSCRRLVSRIFGANDCARTVSELLPNSAKLRQSADPRCCWQPRRKPPPRGTPAQPALRRMPKGSKGEVKPSREVPSAAPFSTYSP